jgi:hypothetical protein
MLTDGKSRTPTKVLLPIAERSSVVCTCVRVYVSAQHMECHVLCDGSLQKPYSQSLKRVRRLFIEMPRYVKTCQFAVLMYGHKEIPSQVNPYSTNVAYIWCV